MDATAICPACGQGLQPDNRLFCPSCGQAQHRTCLEQRHACASCSFTFMPPAPGAPTIPTAPTGVNAAVMSPGPAPMGVHRPCKQCNHPFPQGAVRCPHCGFVPKSSSSPVIIFALVGCLCMFMVVPILAAILVPNFIRARAQGQLTACKSNEKNIGTALEMWSTDNSGHYPDSLSALTPNYLRMIPKCPAAESDTYSASYEHEPPKDEKGYGTYSFCCKGDNHQGARIAPDNPSYNSMEGLVVDPR